MLIIKRHFLTCSVTHKGVTSPGLHKSFSYRETKINNDYVSRFLPFLKYSSLSLSLQKDINHPSIFMCLTYFGAKCQIKHFSFTPSPDSPSLSHSYLSPPHLSVCKWPWSNCNPGAENRNLNVFQSKTHGSMYLITTSLQGLKKASSYHTHSKHELTSSQYIVQESIVPCYLETQESRHIRKGNKDKISKQQRKIFIDFKKCLKWHVIKSFHTRLLFTSQCHRWNTNYYLVWAVTCWQQIMKLNKCKVHVDLLSKA